MVRGIHKGQEYKEKVEYSPTLYAISQQKTDFSTLHGQYVKPIQFGNISKARDFRRNYNTDNAPIFGMDRYQRNARDDIGYARRVHRSVEVSPRGKRRREGRQRGYFRVGPV